MLRAVIYCRCSTEEESQKEALKKQVREAKESVRANGWQLADEYIESKSGTTAKKRSEYQRLFDDLHTDKFDIVQIKSQDRLMRNTKDWYLFIDCLVTNEKRLYMYMERKFYTPDDALITGIKAILAEEYSKELSKKINNAHRNRQRQGESFMIPPETYGYKKLPDKSIRIVEEEAKVIRLMFHLCQTMGCGRIAAILESEGYHDRKGQFFTEEAIRRIIRNPIRCGTVVQNRRHFDFQLKQELKMPQEEWIVHKDAIPAIVSEEIWNRANSAMDERAGACHKNQSEPGPGGRFELSGKIRCGLCGGKYYRTCRRIQKDQTKVIEWKCQNYLRYGRNDSKKTRPEMKKAPKIEGKGCDNIHLKEQQLLKVLENVCASYHQRYGLDDRKIMNTVVSVLNKVFNRSDPSEKSRELEELIGRQEALSEKLVDKLLEGVIGDEAYQKKKIEFDDKLQTLRKKQEGYACTNENHKEAENRIHQIEKRLKEELLRKAALSEMLENVESMEVFEDKIEMRFYLEQSLEINNIPLNKESERERIVRYMKEKPTITAKEIAEREGIGLTTANYRIKKLRQQGKIYYEGRGGHGQWVVK